MTSLWRDAPSLLFAFTLELQLLVHYLLALCRLFDHQFYLFRDGLKDQGPIIASLTQSYAPVNAAFSHLRDFSSSQAKTPTFKQLSLVTPSAKDLMNPFIF
jgi:hypothetical protein